MKNEIDEYVESTSVSRQQIYETSKKHFDELISQNREIMYSYLFSDSWEVDQVIYLSEDGKRLYSHIMNSHPQWMNAPSDHSNEFIGAFIYDKWYYLLGDQIIFPRRHYKHDEITPLTFEEMSYLINKGLFEKVISNVDGQYVTSKEFFSKKLGPLDSSKEGGDSLFLSRVAGYSTNTVSPEKFNLVRQELLKNKRIIQPKLSTWQRWFGKKKLFDTKEWKNRRSE